MTAFKIGRHVRLDGMQPHRITSRIVEGEGDEIDMDNTRKALSQISKKLIQIAVNRDRLRDFQQGLVSFRQGLAGRCGRGVHRQ